MIAWKIYLVRDRQAYCLYIQRPLGDRRYTNSFRGEPRTPSSMKAKHDKEKQHETCLHPFPLERLRCDQEKAR